MERWRLLSRLYCGFNKLKIVSILLRCLSINSSSNDSSDGNPPLKTTVLISRIFRKLHAGRFCMRKSRFTDSQILAVLKQAENGVPVPELCREHGISSATFYKWRSKFGGMDASMMARLKELEDENRRLKKMYAEERLKAEILKEAIEKKWWSRLAAVRWRKRQSQTKRSVSGWRVVCSESVRPATDTRPGWAARMPWSPTGCCVWPRISATGALVCASCICVMWSALAGTTNASTAFTESWSWIVSAP